MPLRSHVRLLVGTTKGLFLLDPSAALEGPFLPGTSVLSVDGQSIRAGSALGLETPVAAGAEVWILPAVSGG